MHQGDWYYLNNYFECNTWGPNVWDFYHLTHLCRVLQILCTWSYVHETGATIEITRTCVEMVHQVMMEWRMLKALHGIGLMISQSWLSMECSAMTCVTGIHASHLQSWYVWTLALLTLCYQQVDHTPFPSSYDMDKLSWNSTVCYNDGYPLHYVVKLSSSYIRITTKEPNFMPFVFVSLVSVHFMTTEKQDVKCENYEFCCCCQEGNIRNVCCCGAEQPRDYWRVSWRWNFLTAAPLSTWD